MNRLKVLCICILTIIGASSAAGDDGTRPFSVGLVLSGGGAKGVAHIGLIQALEENEIPVDYIAGTSIGAVVGSMYAIGMTPLQMLKLMKSRDFDMWQSGVISEEWLASYREDYPQSKAFRIRLALSDSLKFPTRLLSRHSLVDPAPMKFGMFEVYSLHTLRCHQSFDSLFVPFRAVASDVCNKSPVVLCRGDLGNAVQASMSFPFVFQPTEVEGVLFYDGGIYNNFPLDVVCREFQPDFVIGSVVSDNPQCPESHDIIGQLESMVVQYTDYDIPDSMGVRIRMRLSDVGLLDFHKADEIFAIGYQAGLVYADSIRTRIGRLRTIQELTEARRRYLDSRDSLNVGKIEVSGVSESQKRYVLRHFRSLDLPALRAGFYELASDDKISDIGLQLVNGECEMPGQGCGQEGVSSPQILRIDMKMNRNLDFRVGGLLTTVNGSRFFMGLGYKSIQKVATDIRLEAQMGSSYYSTTLALRTEVPTDRPVISTIRLSWFKNRYSQGEIILDGRSEVSHIRHSETYAEWLLGVPLNKRGKLIANVGYGNLEDVCTAQREWKGAYNLLRTGVELRCRKMKEFFYPDKGYQWNMKWNYYMNRRERWWKGEACWEKYWSLLRYFSLGGKAQFVWSNTPKAGNPVLSEFRLPAFEPYGYSMQVFNGYLRARRFGVVGLAPVWKLFRNVQLRLDGYWFQPIQKFVGGTFDWKNYFVGDITCLLKTPVADFAGFVNVMKTGRSHFQIGIRAGFLLNEIRF